MLRSSEVEQRHFSLDEAQNFLFGVLLAKPRLKNAILEAFNEESPILEKERLKEMVELLKLNKTSRIKLLRTFSRYFPRCQICGSRYRIDIVLFGEILPEDELNRAYQQLDNCNALMLVGTSLVVYPAAGLPLYAKEKGVKLIEVNREPSDLSDLCDYQIRGQASQILPEILNLVGN